MSDPPPILALHGSFGQGADWDDLRRSWPKRTFLTPDLPAHGARPHERASGFDALVEELVASLPECADLVGYSLGGRLALGVALRAPERVRSLVLESAHPGLTPDERPERARRDAANARALAEDPEAFLERFWSAPLFDSFRAHPGFAAERARRVERARRDPAALAATFEALSPAYQGDGWAALGQLEVPLLFVAGALDAKYAALGARVARTAPAARCALVEGAGHNVHFEAPARFAAHVASFWAGLDGGGGAR